MGTLFDYLTWRGDIPFEQVPLNEVDSLIFSLLSYMEYKGIVSSEHDAATVSLQSAANAVFARNPDPKKITMGALIPREIVRLLRMTKECRRFRNVGLKAYVNRIDLEQQMQFSAITYCLETGESVIAYRGTDDSLVGWKENFNMSFMDEVPAQKQALAYLIEAADVDPDRPLFLTGHSKGGNLAVYASIHCKKDIQKRMQSVWCNDGPGFRHAWFEDPSYLDIKPIIHTLVPQSSVVGMLLEHDESYSVVKSRQKGLYQHDGLTWEVQGGCFVRLQQVSEESKRTDRALREWIQKMTLEQREQFCDALYQLLSADNALTITDLLSVKNRWVIRGMKLDPEVRKTVLKTLQTLIQTNTKTLIGDLLPKQQNKKD